MDLEKHKRIFDTISSIYNLFFENQVKNYSKIYKTLEPQLKLIPNSKILDMGCGTGAFSKTFTIAGHALTGVDISKNMISYAKKRGINAKYGNILEGLNYKDNTFDHVISAYVAHGLDKEKRDKLFSEASRLSKGVVIFHDYGIRSNPVIKFIECLEDGDYFNFIKTGLEEMKQAFFKVEVLPVTAYHNWYICTPY